MDSDSFSSSEWFCVPFSGISDLEGRWIWSGFCYLPGMIKENDLENLSVYVHVHEELLIPQMG